MVAPPAATEESGQKKIRFAPSTDEVAKRAYFSYLNHGSRPGHDVQNWLEAETQLHAEHYLPKKHPISATETHNNHKDMKTPIIARDLTRQPPHSPRVRLAGFVIARRTIDKCRASVAGTLGEYHYDCPLDNMLFSFKGITGDQFKAVVQNSENYEDVGDWLLANGTPKTPTEIKAWSHEMEAGSPMKNPEKRAGFIENCTKLGLSPEKSTTFDWLDADDRVSFRHRAA